jgi:MFS transporter, PAT family, solute carrier family 33 (acetyl-CoA transportor), member 1
MMKVRRGVIVFLVLAVPAVLASERADRPRPTSIRRPALHELLPSPKPIEPRRDVLLAARSGKSQSRAAPLGAKSDLPAIALLILLYTLQGIPMGLGGAMPMLMLERGVGTMEQAVFSTVTLPFALKLLWAPLVDSVYSTVLGRRKTWILPVQAAIGMIMITAGGRVDLLLGPVGGATPVNVKALTALFLAFYFLAATQDIAVDGLALTALSPANRELGATCNAIGQSLGFFLAYVGFIILHSRGLTTLGNFMKVWGWLFLGSIGAVVTMTKNDEHTRPTRNVARNLVDTYGVMAKVLALPSVRSLAVVLLTRGAPFAAFDVLLPLELQANGVKKQQLALLSTMLLPISMASQAVVSRFFRQGASPMRIFVGAAYARLLQGALATGLVFLLRTCVPAGAGVPLWLLGLGLLVLALGAVASSSMFVAQMAFFNRVSDARIGGTYLTMLNTLANLGGQWPGTIVLALKGAINDTPGSAKGFYMVAVGSTLLGIAWLYAMRSHIFALQDRPAKDWLATETEERAH